MIVHAEIWPGAIKCDEGFHDIRDAAQVLSYVHWAADHDSRGTLADYFAVAGLAAADRAMAASEGWILGFDGVGG